MSDAESRRSGLAAIRDESDIDLLAAVGSPPTAPFHEAGVAAVVNAELRTLGLRPLIDDWGNVYARVTRGSTKQALALVAHMDHPGFEAAPDGGDGVARAKVLGGLVAPLFRESVALRFFPRDGGSPVAARTTGVREHGPRDRDVAVEFDGPRPPAGSFGILDLPDFERRGDRVYLRAVDDLAGCAAILAALRRIVRDDTPCDVWAVFTRAEEVGLVGATHFARARTMPADTIVVSLETSKALPGAEMGGGPVIRVGDAQSAFHPEADAVLLAARARLTALGLPIQRQLMSGGTCEATTFNRHGYRATGISIPLENYHNRTPDDRVAAEGIVADDYHGAVALLAALPPAAVDGVPTDGVKRLVDLAERFDSRLRGTADAYRAAR